MAKRRRSSPPSNAPPEDRSSAPLHNSIEKRPSEAVLSDPTSKSGIAQYLTTLLERAPSGKWLRVLPEQDDYDSIYFPTNQKWDNILPVLIHGGYVYSDNRFGKLTVKTSEWNNLGIHFDKFEVTRSRMKDKSRPAFLCKGRPDHKNPMDQLKSEEEIIPVPATRASVELANLFLKAKITLLNDVMAALVRNMEEPPATPSFAARQQANTTTMPIEEHPVTPSYTPRQPTTRNMITPPNTFFPPQQPTQPTQPTQPQQPQQPQQSVIVELHKKWQDQIVFALALDLERRPRLQRNGGDPIEVHKKVQADETSRQLAVHTATYWGYKNPMLSHRQRMRRRQWGQQLGGIKARQAFS
jgi:hypothetical protein